MLHGSLNNMLSFSLVYLAMKHQRQFSHLLKYIFNCKADDKTLISRLVTVNEFRPIEAAPRPPNSQPHGHSNGASALH